MSPLSHIAQNASVSREPAGHKSRLAGWLAGRICLGKRCQESLRCTRTLVLKYLESTRPFVATDKHVFVALFNRDHVALCGEGRGMGERKGGFVCAKIHLTPPPLISLPRTAWLTRVLRMEDAWGGVRPPSENLVCTNSYMYKTMLSASDDVCRGSFVE